MQSLISASEQRADDLRRTLRTFDAGRGGGRFSLVLQQFEQLSRQLILLQDRSTDTNAEALLERHFAVPSSVSGFEPGLSAAAVPSLLSTALDKEQEERAPHPALFSADEAKDGPSPTAATIASHNGAIDRALDHLARSALRADLPGAGDVAQDGGKKNKRVRRH